MIKKLLGVSLVGSAVFLASCSEPVVPSESIDQLTLAFLDAKIYSGGAVVCDPKQVEERIYVGCYQKGLDGNSQVSLWLYQGGVFKAINGTARTLAEGKLLGNPVIEILPLPIPSDIKIDAVLAQFK